MLELDLFQMRAVSGGVVAIGGSRTHKETRTFVDADGNEYTEEVDVVDSGDNGGGGEPNPEPDPDWLDKLKEFVGGHIKVTTTEPDVPPADQVVVITAHKMTNEEKDESFLQEKKALADKLGLDMKVTMPGATRSVTVTGEISATPKLGGGGTLTWQEPTVEFVTKQSGK